MAFEEDCRRRRSACGALRRRRPSRRSWGDDDTIIAALGTPGQLSRVPATGGTPRVAIDLSAESIDVRWPQLLPDAEAVVYTALSGAGADRANIEVQSADGGNRKVLVQGGTFGRYLRAGTHLHQPGRLYAVTMDLRRLGLRPRFVLDNVAYSSLSVREM